MFLLLFIIYARVYSTTFRWLTERLPVVRSLRTKENEEQNKARDNELKKDHVIHASFSFHVGSTNIILTSLEVKNFISFST